MTRIKTSTRLLISALAMLSLSGCISYTCSTVSCNSPSIGRSDVRFYVRSFTLSPAATVYPFGSYSSSASARQARVTNIRSAFARHTPGLFTDSSEGAVPIDVTVNATRKTAFFGDFLLSFLCGFTYGILPSRSTYDLDISVVVKLSDGFEVQGTSQVPVRDDRSEYVLMFYSPINLILASTSTKCNGVRAIGSDTYDWYPTEKLGEIVGAALTKFDQRQLKTALEKAALPQVDFTFGE